MGKNTIPLGKVVDALRNELAKLQAKAQTEDLRFRVEAVEVFVPSAPDSTRGRIGSSALFGPLPLTSRGLLAQALAPPSGGV